MTQKYRMLRICLAVCLILTMCIIPATASAYSAKINSSNAKIYSSSGISVSLPKGTSVTVKDVESGWAKVSCKGETGYVRLKYLTAKDGVTGYISKKTGLYKAASSSSSKLATLPKGTKLEVVGVSGGYYQVTNGSVYGYVDKDNVSRSKPSTKSKTSWTDKVELVSWFSGGKDILDKGDYGYIYDIDTGITVKVKCMYGTNHADLEPVTKADTAKLKKIAGGSFSWDSQAVILRAGGRYVAAAINTMPHGDQTIASNNYDGQFCLHMLGSKTHGSDSVNEAHQASIQRAYKWAKSK